MTADRFCLGCGVLLDDPKAIVGFQYCSPECLPGTLVRATDADRDALAAYLADGQLRTLQAQRLAARRLPAGSQLTLSLERPFP